MGKPRNSLDHETFCTRSIAPHPDRVHDSDSSCSCSSAPREKALRTRTVSAEIDDNISPVRDAGGPDSVDDVAVKRESLAPHEPSHRGKQVSWGTLNMKLYPIICGDHPDCVHGPPLTIAWNHVAEVTISIDEVESKRLHKTNSATRIDWLARRQLVRSLGASNADIDEAQNESRRCRQQREATLSRMRFLEWRDKVVRRLGRTFHVKASPERNC